MIPVTTQHQALNIQLEKAIEAMESDNVEGVWTTTRTAFKSGTAETLAVSQLLGLLLVTNSH